MTDMNIRVSQVEYGDEDTKVTFECSDAPSGFYEFVSITISSAPPSQTHDQLIKQAHEQLAHLLGSAASQLRYVVQNWPLS